MCDRGKIKKRMSTLAHPFVKLMHERCYDQYTLFIIRCLIGYYRMTIGK